MCGHLIWLPVLPKDDRDAAQSLANTIDDPRVTLYWNGDQSLGFTMRETLQLTSPIAWDVYLLYPPHVNWQLESPPVPTYWMHQLSIETTPNWLDSGELTIRLTQLLKQTP
jgi:hypothetical protein